MIAQDIEIFTLFLLIAGYKERVQRNIYFSINTRNYFEKKTKFLLHFLGIP